VPTQFANFAEVQQFLARLEDEIARACNGIPEFGIAQQKTGAAAPALGSNGPMTVTTAPYTWFLAKANDGTVVYIPGWK
jgi:hypothetical protein